MKKVFVRGIIVDKSQDFSSWENFAKMWMFSLGNFMFGVMPTWDDNKTLTMMKMCHMTEKEVEKMRKDNPFIRMKGLLQKVREKMDNSKFIKAKLKITIEYELEEEKIGI